MTNDDNRVRITTTPNPDAYMFHVTETLIPSGTFEFYADSEKSHAPLAERLFENEGIELVLIASRFITIRKHKEVDWEPLADDVYEALLSFLDSGEMAVYEVAEKQEQAPLGPVEEQILSILDSEVRPAIAQDGGDFIYHGFKNGVVLLELIGACGTCPSSMSTLKYGIQNLLMEEIPEVTSVEQV